MEALASSSSAIAPPSLLIFSPSKSNRHSSKRVLRLSASSESNRRGPDLRSDSDGPSIDPILSNQTLSEDAAMGLVLSAANVCGWTTGSGMEGPPVPAGGNPESGKEQVSTFPWSLFTKSPRRRMLVAFTCKVCGQRTTRAINPHAYTDGTVFVQCCGCNIYHKLVDNLNLFHDMKCYVNSSFNPDSIGALGFGYFELDDDKGDDTSQQF
ncbi:hypothetical protein DM860_016897 [Cuscuta australis]|uniref:DNL-type domain-containing protein n=1 Tax=Cuscuta australis TaxID=267555 RepID=A0A328DYX3_9ASTE|nr:hypothetical protein DM860_016897 [Cuscuta australis]